MPCSPPVVSWDPQQYLRFAQERARPLDDLVARVQASKPARVVDLGCGPGTLTRRLLDRWPTARIEGIDSSPEMIAAAEPLTVPGRLTFAVDDVRSWHAVAPVDVVVSNATLQWVAGHVELLPRLVAALAPQGELAVQVPANHDEPTHMVLRELCADARWADRLEAVARPWSADPLEYLDVLTATGCRVDVWQTIYHHVLPDVDAVVEWMKGTGLRPVLTRLAGAERGRFLAEYRDRLAPAYPTRPAGTVLRYRRTFVVAQRQ